MQTLTKVAEVIAAHDAYVASVIERERNRAITQDDADFYADTIITAYENPAELERLIWGAFWMEWTQTYAREHEEFIAKWEPWCAENLGAWERHILFEAIHLTDEGMIRQIKAIASLKLEDYLVTRAQTEEGISLATVNEKFAAAREVARAKQQTWQHPKGDSEDEFLN